MEAGWDELCAGAPRDAYRRALLEIARADPRVLCLDSDMGGLEDTFGAELPDRYVNFGIAEATMMSAAAALAASGRIPFVNTMASFATTRAGEQLKVDVASGALPVKIVATHAGLSAGHYGPTHHALEDVAIVRALPNVAVLVPADTVETVLAVRAAARAPGPVYVRLGRAETPRVHGGPFDFRIGRAVTLRTGADVTIAACGPHPVLLALEAAERLAADGVEARVLDLHTVRPLDEPAVVAAATGTAGIVTVEEHAGHGGLGGAVAEVTAERAPCRVLRVAAEGGACERVGDQAALLEAVGVTADRVLAAARRLVADVTRPEPVPYRRART
ncbi:MAG TPA: transketolase C-terminal domain-containing protein [Candidatus Dormibacteraeota bacterium]